MEYVLNTTTFVEEEEEGRLSTLQRNKKKSFRDNCFGINKLINLQVFDDAYPVHDGDLEDEGNKFAKDYNFEKINIKVVRGVSCTASGECSRISTNSSLWMPSKITMVCNVTLKQLLFFYVAGVEFALYFSWLGFLNYALIPPTIAGIFVFFYGTHLIGTDVPQTVSLVLKLFVKLRLSSSELFVIL